MLEYPMLKPHPFTVDDFMVMVNAGLFEDQRVELLDGMIVDVSPADPAHEYTIDKLVKRFYRLLPQDVLVRVQNSIDLALPEWLPYPNIAVIKPRDYLRSRPQPSDVFLLIEIANTSLQLGLGRRREVYARANIKDYWVADINAQRWTVHRNPEDEHYQKVFEVAFGETLAPLAFPEEAQVWLWTTG